MESNCNSELTTLLQRFGKALREIAVADPKEPMPERWIELINRLNVEDDCERKRSD